MAKITIILSGILAATAWCIGAFLYLHDSPLADFVRLACFPFFTLIFLLTLFLVRIRRISATPRTKNIFRGLRVAALLGIAAFCIAVFWPRSYDPPIRTKSDSLRYWDLPTGSRIAYTLIHAKGTLKPTPIIYLQGGPGGTIGEGLTEIMTPIAGDGYDIYLYDQVGSGWSNRLANIRDYTAIRHKQDLEAIVRSIGADKVILIGQSWGAILATLYAADNPGRVAAMILTSPGPIQPAHPKLAGVKPPDSVHLRAPYYTNRQGNDRANNIRTRAMALFATSFGKKLASDNEADDFAGYLNNQIDWSTVCDTSLIPKFYPAVRPPTSSGPAGFYAGLITVQSFPNTSDPRPKLQNSSIPILVMKGQCDNQKWGFTNEYLQIFPHHQLAIIPDAGHGLFGEQPERYLSTIRGFLKAQ